MQKSILLLLACLSVCFTHAQIKMPPASPTFELKGTVGFADVKVVYSRPSAKGRAVAGNLIPYGEVWRTGANASTKISFSEDVTLNGNPVPAGEYALYTQFSEETATIILNKNLELWGSMGYDQNEDQIRFNVPVKHPSSHYETFTISFSDFTRNSANLNMKWEHTKAMFKIETVVESRIMADLKEQLIDNTPTNPRVFYQGALYYMETDNDTNQALEWIDKAIELSDKPVYWMIGMKGQILAKLGKKKEAIDHFKKSTELAKAAGNPDYVRQNERLVQSLK